MLELIEGVRVSPGLEWGREGRRVALTIRLDAMVARLVRVVLLPDRATRLACRDGSPTLLDLEQFTVCVVAVRLTVPLDARLTAELDPFDQHGGPFSRDRGRRCVLSVYFGGVGAGREGDGGRSFDL